MRATKSLVSMLNRFRSTASAPAQRAAPIAEPLECRLLMALAKAAGGSGYSANLSTNPTIRRQQLLCDPDAPIAGSTSVLYDPKLVSLVDAAAGPGFANDSFRGFVEVQLPTLDDQGEPITMLQSFGSFMTSAQGAETGYVQFNFTLSLGATAGQMEFDRGFVEVAHAGAVEGVDTHSLTFELLPDVPVDAFISYTVFAAHKGTHSNNSEDYLEAADGTILGPDDLAPATVSTAVFPRAELRPDPSDKSRSALFVLGSSGDDVIRFKTHGRKNNRMIEVLDHGKSLGTFDASSFTRVIADGSDGDDVIGACDVPSVFLGGKGDDLLLLGAGNGIGVGGAGDDAIHGGRGADLLVGGLGSDVLLGGLGEDILVAGQTSFDRGSADDIDALTDILTEWTRRGTNYATRINHIRGTTPGGLNGSSLLTSTGSNPTVFDDGVKDLVFGGAGRDWLFITRTENGAGDWTDLLPPETATPI